MTESKTSWPAAVVITAALIGGAVAGLYLYSTRTSGDAGARIRDAQDIIDQCHQQIKELEASALKRIDALKKQAT